VRTAAAAAAGLLAGTLLIAVPAHAAPNTATPYPTFTGSATPVPDERTGYHVRNQLQAIFDADVAAGAGSSPDNDFWFDKMLARTGNLPGGSNGDANAYLFSRGRAVFMKTHAPNVLGFGGEVAYIESIAGGQGAYTVTASINGADLALTEDVSQRKQTPSYFRTVFNNTGSGLRITETKYITDANVAVSTMDIASTDGAAKSVTLTAASAFAKTTASDNGELTGAVRAFNQLTTIFPRFSGDGFAPVDGTLRQTLAVPATGSAATKVQLGFTTRPEPGGGLPGARHGLQPVVGRQRALPGHAREQHRQDAVLPLVADAVQLPRRRPAGQRLPVPDVDGGRARVQQRDRAVRRHVRRRPQVLP
jgi:hypothetical protein